MAAMLTDRRWTVKELLHYPLSLSGLGWGELSENGISQPDSRAWIFSPGGHFNPKTRLESVFWDYPLWIMGVPNLAAFASIMR